MNGLRFFENPEFGVIRTVEESGENWFVGKDVARALGYSNPRKAMADHVDEDDKGVTKRDTPGGQQEMTIVNESGLYSLILSSKLPTAKKFKRWVTSEVLPSIRKNGGYIAGQEQMSEKEVMAKALLLAQNIIDSQKKEIEDLKPKALFADTITSSETSVPIGTLAKLIQQGGVGMGQNRLFKWMRDSGYLISRRGAEQNMPTQRAVEQGLFEIHESAYENNGRVFINRSPRVTAKGQAYFIKKFIK